MVRPYMDAFRALFCAVLLAGCGGEIARIEGLPQTRDTSADPWPRLVDTPAPPEGLRVETGVAAMETLDRTRTAVLDRAAQPGPQRVARADLGNRVARIRQQSSTDAQGVDEAELAARAARLAQVRATPVGGIPAEELAMRARRVADARRTAVDGVDAGGLQARAQRIAAARITGPGGVGAFELQARAQRVTAARDAPATSIDPDVLYRIAARPPPTPAPPILTRPARPIRPVDTSVPAPRPKPVSPPKDRSTPVISDSFRKRAEEARRRARERAATGAAE